MDRVIDLSVKPYSTPEGYAGASANPLIGWEKPESPILSEPVGRSRDLASLLSYNKRRLAMVGVQPGEIFNYGVITTKPFGTYLTFSNPEANGRFSWRYASDLPAERFTGYLTLVDLTNKIKPGDEILLEHLEPSANKIRKDCVVFLYTGYSKKHRPHEPHQDYYTNSPTLSLGAAEWLISRGIRTIGADVRSLDPAYTGHPTEHNIRMIFNAAGVLVVEDLANLDQIRSTHNYAITGMPLGVRGVTGGPARVFVIDRNNPADFVDCTHPLEYYPDPITDEFPFTPPITNRPKNMLGDYPNPIPGRINPRELGTLVMRETRLTPFAIYDEELGYLGQEMYIQYGHGSTTHIEAAFFDPWGRHMIPEEILRRYVRIPADRLIGEGVLMDLSDQLGPGMQVEIEHLLEYDPGVKEGDILFVRWDISDNYFYGESTVASTPGFSASAAKWMVKKKIRALVLEAAVERSEPLSTGIRFTSNKIHYLLHRNDIPIVDWGWKFRNFRKNRFIAAIMALPVSHQGGFPAHVLAIEDWS
jgi:kynurenine formamidase